MFNLIYPYVCNSVVKHSGMMMRVPIRYIELCNYQHRYNQYATRNPHGIMILLISVSICGESDCGITVDSIRDGCL